MQRVNATIYGRAGAYFAYILGSSRIGQGTTEEEAARDLRFQLGEPKPVREARRASATAGI